MVRDLARLMEASPGSGYRLLQANAHQHNRQPNPTHQGPSVRCSSYDEQNWDEQNWDAISIHRAHRRFAELESHQLETENKNASRPPPVVRHSRTRHTVVGELVSVIIFRRKRLTLVKIPEDLNAISSFQVSRRGIMTDTNLHAGQKGTSGWLNLPIMPSSRRKSFASGRIC